MITVSMLFHFSPLDGNKVLLKTEENYKPSVFMCEGVRVSVCVHVCQCVCSVRVSVCVCVSVGVCSVCVCVCAHRQWTTVRPSPPSYSSCHLSTW